MGQYYTPVLFREHTTDFTNTLNLRGVFDTFDYDSGSKLMEHSWKPNPMLLTIMNKIQHFGRVRVVWAGDYADEEPNGKTIYKIVSDFGIYTKCSNPPRQPSAATSSTTIRRSTLTLTRAPKATRAGAYIPLPCLPAKATVEVVAISTTTIRKTAHTTTTMWVAGHAT